MSKTTISKLRRYCQRIGVEEGRIPPWKAEVEGIALHHPWSSLPLDLDQYLTQLRGSDSKLYSEARELVSMVKEYRKSHPDCPERVTGKGKER